MDRPTSRTELLRRMVETREVPVGRRSTGTFVSPKKRVGRNDPCPCGSGKKFKRCCYQYAAVASPPARKTVVVESQPLVQVTATPTDQSQRAAVAAALLSTTDPRFVWAFMLTGLYLPQVESGKLDAIYNPAQLASFREALAAYDAASPAERTRVLSGITRHKE